MMKTERRHPYHYTREQHLQPEDYSARWEFCTWLLNLEENTPNFVARILFSDESTFGRQGCFNAHNWHIWAEESTCSISKSISRKIFHKFVGWSIKESCGMSAIEIRL
jgi:hypothetical protein